MEVGVGLGLNHGKVEFKISRFQDFKISTFQHFNISRFQDFKSCQHFQISTFQNVPYYTVPYFKISTFQHSNISLTIHISTFQDLHEPYISTFQGLISRFNLEGSKSNDNHPAGVLRSGSCQTAQVDLHSLPGRAGQLRQAAPVLALPSAEYWTLVRGPGLECRVQGIEYGV